MATREEAAERMKAAKAALSAFKAEHTKILERLRTLEEEVRVAYWPPEGFEECAGEDQEGNECCSALLPSMDVHGDGPDHPGGWVEEQYSNRDGGSGRFFCPEHAHQVRHGSRRDPSDY